MISDVLFEALVEIERYQREMPGVYENSRAEIDAVKVAMRALQWKLDLPPDNLRRGPAARGTAA